MTLNNLLKIVFHLYQCTIEICVAPPRVTGLLGNNFFLDLRTTINCCHQARKGTGTLKSFLINCKLNSFIKLPFTSHLKLSKYLFFVIACFNKSADNHFKSDVSSFDVVS